MNAADLREEISMLDRWIEQRQAELMAVLIEFDRRERDLIRLSSSVAEIDAHNRRTRELRAEMDQLNEVRQIRELKVALVEKLERKLSARAR